jgi:cytochrome c-type biogenesis protein CcmH
MTVLLFAIFLLLALAAAGFAAWPLLRDVQNRGRYVLGAALAVVVLGLGLGVYVMLGSPLLALRSLTGPSPNDVRGLVATLAVRVHDNPSDPRGWMLLGRGYLSLDDPSDAAAAFKQALFVAPPSARGMLLSAYGEALTDAQQGNVPPEAEAAFTAALKADPHDGASRFYLGQVAAQRGDRDRALALWNSLLADTPPDTPVHGMLLDRIASLTAQSGGAPPDIGAMVAGLAARLKANPNDAQGWLRLIRAYSVLGDKAKAQAALADARVAMRADTSASKAIDAEAKADGL